MKGWIASRAVSSDVGMEIGRDVRKGVKSEGAEVCKDLRRSVKLLK
jgi:hypothetical protein